MSIPYDRRPLPERLRPQSWEDIEGLESIEASLRGALMGKGGSAKAPPSVILWGPPGTGKTTIARLIGATFPVYFEQLSAVLDGVKEVRAVVERAKEHSDKPTVLFVDEIHRFTKAQQDAFLPHIEQGTIVLVGATTENPSFSVTKALLSRVKVAVLKPLSREALLRVAKRALGATGLELDQASIDLLVMGSGGDGRKLISLIEVIEQLSTEERTPEGITRYLKEVTFVYDKDGDQHYDLISAFIKSLRGSDPDAALYYGFRILSSGEDPRFLIRRMMIFAAEDVGNADPQALSLAVATFTAYENLGLPEGRIPIAQCITYLASVPKSNRSYQAMHKALAAVQQFPHAPVPLQLRNAPTELLQRLGAGEGYKYPHDYPGGVVPGERYLPTELGEARFYEPKEIGLEGKIKARLEAVRKPLG